MMAYMIWAGGANRLFFKTFEEVREFVQGPMARFFPDSFGVYKYNAEKDEYELKGKYQRIDAE